METRPNSFNQIVRSTTIFGGSQLGTMILSILRTKILAVILGRSGVGYLGLLQSIVDFVKSLSGLGLSFSAVKDVAVASGSNDSEKISQTLTMMRRWLYLTSLLGLLLTILFAPAISRLFFDNYSESANISLLSICVFSAILSSGKLSILQGFRKISWLAQASFFSALGSLMISVPLYLWLHQQGILPALILSTLLTLIITWLYTGRIKYTKANQTWAETLRKGKGMVELGVYSMVAGLIGTATMLAIRGFILQSNNEETLGLYQAVWSISNVYIAAILSSMGADFYPRLCEVNQHSKRLVELTNEQLKFTLLFVAPCFILMLLLARPILNILYSGAFEQATEFLRYQLAGTFFKVLIWPVGYILLAKNKGKRFLLVEVVWHVAYLGATVAFWPYMGLNAAGLAFLLAYIVYIPMVYALVKPLCGFRLDQKNLFLIFGNSVFFAVSFCLLKFDVIYAKPIAGLLFVISIVWSVMEIHRMIPISRWGDILKKIIKRRFQK
jgi:enterobacterial common antigen flippase